LRSADDLLVDEMVVFPDNHPDAWYYLAVKEATNSTVPDYHDEQVPGLHFDYKFWIEMLETPDWRALETIWVDNNSG